MSETSPGDATVDQDIGEAIRLILKAEENGDWVPLVGWLAHNPTRAGDVARFLADQDRIPDIFRETSLRDRTGSMIGEFEIKELIGRGGNADVYEAFDSILERRVAVKLIRSDERFSFDELSKLNSEAKDVASLDHPNIVRVLSFGEANGEPYLVMPLMAKSLAAKLKQLGPHCIYQADDAAKLVRDIAQGVHHAHQNLLIHRDLKPGNILLDHKDTPYVADFGLARRVDVSNSTAAGLAGTVLYMAPEQARVDKRLTTGVDVHALGAILFELLTGRRPYGDDVAIALQKLTDPNEPVPSVLKLRPATPREIAAICDKCLQREPSLRYASAQEVADDLDRYLRREPVKAHPQRLLSALGGEIARPPQLVEMRTWQGVLWGAASTCFAMGVMQAAILLHAPIWVSQLAIVYYLLGWLGLMWGFLVVRRAQLNPFERSSMKIHFGAKFGCIAILPVVFWLHDGNPVYALPAYMVITGLAVYVHGITYWGRFYLNGLLFFAVAATMPLVPIKYWPAAYGLLLGVYQVLAGIHLRRVQHKFELAHGCQTATATPIAPHP